MKYFYIILLILSLNAIQASIFSKLKENVLSLIQRSRDDTEYFHHPETKRSAMRYFQHKHQEDAKDKKSAQNKASILKNVRTHEENLNIGRDMPSSKRTESLNKKIGREYFHMDPVLNELRRRSRTFRRKGSSEKASSELDMKHWKDEWADHWMQKKFEALNSSQPKGDVVNMVAARPWGIPCGDPNQHDIPWGSCTLPMECDAEYRIYRGDSFCGRTQYVCCSLLLTNYEMYQGLDVSFAGSSFSTDSNEKNAKEGSKEGNRKKKKAEKNNRKKERDKRKKEMSDSIRDIVQEIRNILNRAFRNGTAQRKRKTKELKKFIEMLKKQYRKDRKSVVNIHDLEIQKIDEELQKKFDQVENVNLEFMSNATFRDIVVNGTVNRKKLERLLRAHPELAKLFIKRRTDIQLLEEKWKPNWIKEQADVKWHKENMEPNINEESTEIEELEDKSAPNILEYDLEYGKLYY